MVGPVLRNLEFIIHVNRLRTLRALEMLRMPRLAHRGDTLGLDCFVALGTPRNKSSIFYP